MEPFRLVLLLPSLPDSIWAEWTKKWVVQGRGAHLAHLPRMKGRFFLGPSETWQDHDLTSWNLYIFESGTDPLFSFVDTHELCLALKNLTKKQKNQGSWWRPPPQKSTPNPVTGTFSIEEVNTFWGKWADLEQERKTLLSMRPINWSAIPSQ